MSTLYHYHHYRQADHNNISVPQEEGEDEHADRGPAVLAVTAATLTLASVFVAARMVSRIGIVRRFGADDYIIVLAWLITVFLSLSIIFGTMRGLGRHGDHVDAWKMPGLKMCEYVFSILYVSNTGPRANKMVADVMAEPGSHGDEILGPNFLSAAGEEHAKDS